MQKVGCVRWFHDRYYSRLYSNFAKKGAELFYLYPGRNFLFKGAFLWEKSESKNGFLFLWRNPKRDYESNESVNDEDSMD